MTEVVYSSSASSIESSPTRNDELCQHSYLNSTLVMGSTEEEEELVGGGERKRRRQGREGEEGDQLNFVGLFFTVFRRSVFGCSSCDGQGRLSAASASCSGEMEIGFPTNVRHVAHVTFDRFNGFLGLPVEFEPEVPRRAPSASATVFGVSTNSMQLSFDNRGNSVPTILLMMQQRLYALGGLRAEGIFRINADNGQEEYVRDQLNRGLVPDDVDIHCLAGLIKAWFRELPSGVLDCLSPEQVMQCQTEAECVELTRVLPLTEAALLDWAINLMADVAQFENLNKMNARNVAMVFAPNMTHMADPLTALMHAVQVMNFLKTLIEKTLKERENSILDSALDSRNSSRDPSGGNGQQTPLHTMFEEANEPDDEEAQAPISMNPAVGDQLHLDQDDCSIENVAPNGVNQSSPNIHRNDEESAQESKTSSAKSEGAKACKTAKKGPRKGNGRPVVQLAKPAEKTKGTRLVSTVNPRTERIEAWR